jgi:pimeloyl-ACP methyl ester carboxylesterase
MTGRLGNGGDSNPFLYDASVREQQRRASLARARRVIWLRRTLVTALILAAIAAAIVAVVTRPDGRFHRGSVSFAPCRIQLVAAQCGRLAVSEDPHRPGGRSISLRIAVIPASSQPATGALFYLAGGPGGAASTDVPAVDQLFGKVGSTRDLVLVDQRGTGGSHRLSCAPTGIRVEQTAAVAAYVRRCFARLGPEARLYTTAVAMDDLEAVRRALRYDRIDVYGASYGATAAQIYLRLHPRSVRTLILDSGSLLRVPIYEARAANAESALRAQLARCRAQRPCQRAFPRVRSELAALLERAARRTQAFGQTVKIDADAVASTVHALSLEADGVPLIPEVVHRAAQGDYVPLAQEYVDRVGPGLDARARLVMSFVILCSEPWARFDPVRVLQSSTGSYLAGVAESRARLFAQACRFVRQGVVPAGSARLVPTDVPALILAGSADPQDPPANMHGWRTFFRNGRLVVVRGATHGVLAEGCVALVAAQFVDTGTARALDTTCVRRIEQPTFETP